MKHTFYLKSPKSEKETIILFACYFKNEDCKFVYSTGETILPALWDQSAKQPKKSKLSDGVRRQLNRYSDLFVETESLYKRIGEDFTSAILRSAFDMEFKKAATGKDAFFNAFDDFIKFKLDTRAWSANTHKRYLNIRNILKRFEKEKKHALTFHSINAGFHAKFTSYCMGDLGHINNTYARNLGLFKSFMFWAVDQNRTFNRDFTKFDKEPRVITRQIALTFDDLQKIMDHTFENSRLEKVRDVFVFSCVTGMRFGELSLISKSNIVDDAMILKERKETRKAARQIPLTAIAKYILAKYDYRLPLIANQKQNDYIKEVFKALGYTQTVQKVTTRGKDNIVVEMPLYERISTHTARRTFITMLKRQGKSDKLIGSITGHTDMKTLNQYYQVEDQEKREAVDNVFNISVPMRKVN